MRTPQWIKKLGNANFPRAIIKHAVIDFQLNDLFEKAKELFAKENRTFAKMASKDTLRTKTSTNETPSKKRRLKKPPSKKRSVKKTVTKKTPSKKKTKRSVKRKVKALS
jgi:hypothetical protein